MRAFHYTDVPAEPAPDLPGVTLRWVMGENVEAPTFAMRVIDVAPGAATEFHAHPWEHEVFVLRGSGVVRDAGGAEATLGPGTCVYVPAGETHQFANTGDAALRFICVIPNAIPDPSEG